MLFHYFTFPKGLLFSSKTVMFEYQSTERFPSCFQLQEQAAITLEAVLKETDSICRPGKWRKKKYRWLSFEKNFSSSVNYDWFHSKNKRGGSVSVTQKEDVWVDEWINRKLLSDTLADVCFHPLSQPLIIPTPHIKTFISQLSLSTASSTKPAVKFALVGEQMI